MTQQEAEIVNMDPIVGHIGANFIRTVDFDHINTGTKEQSSPRSQRESKGIRLKDRSLPNIRVVQKPASRIHLRMLSALPKSELGLLDHTLEDPWFDYLYEQTAGLGANVYVYDSGFRLTHRVSLVLFWLHPDIPGLSNTWIRNLPPLTQHQNLLQ